MGSPQDELIGGGCKARYLFQNPYKYAIMREGIGRKKAFECQQWRSIWCSRTLKSLGNKAPFIAPEEK
jgi:hypothetical protein